MPTGRRCVRRVGLCSMFGSSLAKTCAAALVRPHFLPGSATPLPIGLSTGATAPHCLTYAPTTSLATFSGTYRTAGLAHFTDDSSRMLEKLNSKSSRHSSTHNK
jgi:hypothetical protein